MAKAKEPTQESAVSVLTDAEMMESLGPLAKQLRSLNQIQEGIAAYFQAKSEIGALIGERNRMLEEIEKGKENLRLTQINIQEQIRMDTESVATKREALEAERKASLKKLDEEIAVNDRTLTFQRATMKETQAELDELATQYDLRSKNMTDEFRKAASEIESALAAKRAELDAVTKAFEDFLKAHGMPTPPVFVPAAVKSNEVAIDG